MHQPSATQVLEIAAQVFKSTTKLIHKRHGGPVTDHKCTDCIVLVHVRAAILYTSAVLVDTCVHKLDFSFSYAFQVFNRDFFNTYMLTYYPIMDI